ncbi:MAG: GNAT family N-acetyltransferase [Chromatiales bacterium]|jgi:predicted N-acyltransferase
MLDVKIHAQIAEINAAQWNALVRHNNPLIRYEFLHAMEEHQCVGEKFGWLPCHIAVYEQQQLIGALPLYQKLNSYGEFVFDHAWADAYARHGLQYFPKLVSAVPYTPVTGQRLLCHETERERVWPLLLQTALQLAEQNGLSGFHCLFPQADEQQFLQQQGLLVRHDCQYHWHNRNYRNFDDFMQALTSRKRKNIRRERQAVSNANVQLRQLNGHTATAEDWRDFARFYNITFEEKWGMATFNRGFFEQVGRQLPDNVLLVLADLDDECIAGSLMYVSDTTLYGRHWGSTSHVDSLHFEACYYQGIEFCIENNIQHFEPGAQGEHKIARGFVPTLTQSAHWLRDQLLLQPIRAFVEHEQQAVVHYMQQLQHKVPYKHESMEKL